MTSKSPMRFCEDADETTLSYAEIKALCAGNPLIKEKMDLDIEVARLRILKSDHKSQHYKLEDNLVKFFPESIEKAKQSIKGFEHDTVLIQSETKPNADGFSPMEIGGVLCTEKEKAGAAILESCKNIRNTQENKIGKYRGFDMYIAFESLSKQYVLTLKGNMSYNIPLGNDTFGNITRINNALAEMPNRLTSIKTHLENLYQQQKNAEAELAKPFAYEKELSQKIERLAYLDSTLNIDSNKPKTQERVDRQSLESAKGKPSLLDNVKEKRDNIAGNKDDKKDKSKEASL